MNPLSFGGLWPQTVAAVRLHTDMLWPLAAAFLFLPQLLMARQIDGRTFDLMFKGDAFGGDVVTLALLVLGSVTGQLVMARLVAQGGTGGEPLGVLLKQALGLLPAGLAVTLIQGLGVGFGLVLLVIPGLWLLSRLAIVVPLVATGHSDPLEAIVTSWRLTRGQAFRIFGMLAVLIFGFLLLSVGIGGIGAAVGVISTIAAGTVAEGWSIGRWLFEMLQTAASAAMSTFYIAFLAVLMQALKAQPAALD